MVAALPDGFGIVLDPGVRQFRPDLWWGGSPAALLRFTAAGSAAWQSIRESTVQGPTAGALARRLTDAGVGHPVPPELRTNIDVTVIVPVRDRVDMLDRCLANLGRRYPVVVVDDGSCDVDAVVGVASRHGAVLLRSNTSRGPAAARNTALRQVQSELVAFLDSDCVGGPEWIAQLTRHFQDPEVAGAAPRIVAWCTGSSPRHCALDMGPRPARVAPYGRVGFVPSAALLARRQALIDVARGGEIFDEALRYGEDVDLVWRLHTAGWRIRYDPSSQVAHEEPSSARALLVRRFRYGTSAAPLALRYPKYLAPLVVRPWSAMAVLALLIGRRTAAVVGLYGVWSTTGRRLRGAGVPTGHATELVAAEVYSSWLGISRYAVRFAAPMLALAALFVHRRGTARGLFAGLMLGQMLSADTDRSGSGRNRMPHSAILDDIAYGCGVVVGCLRHRTIEPLRPQFVPATSREARRKAFTAMRGRMSHRLWRVVS